MKWKKKKVYKNMVWNDFVARVNETVKSIKRNKTKQNKKKRKSIQFNCEMTSKTF